VARAFGRNLLKKGPDRTARNKNLIRNALTYNVSLLNKETEAHSHDLILIFLKEYSLTLKTRSKFKILYK
jgi:hypothetical protein